MEMGCANNLGRVGRVGRGCVNGEMERWSDRAMERWSDKMRQNGGRIQTTGRGFKKAKAPCVVIFGRVMHSEFPAVLYGSMQRDAA